MYIPEQQVSRNSFKSCSNVVGWKLKDQTRLKLLLTKIDMIVSVRGMPFVTVSSRESAVVRKGDRVPFEWSDGLKAHEERQYVVTEDLSKASA